jgi:hypothetical protein
MRSLPRPHHLGAAGILRPSLVLVMSERLLPRNASRRSSGNGCADLSWVPALLVFTRDTQLADKVKKLAGKTHKDRVHEFNSKLESLSEHHDIPKVNIAGIFSTPHLIASSLRLVLDKVGMEHSGVSPRQFFPYAVQWPVLC